MGKVGREIVKMDVDKLIEELNTALADEWLAYYQYWVGSKIVKGPMRDAVAAELTEHAADEMRHANMLAERIVQLGGTPIIDPRDWHKLGKCGYDAPKDPLVTSILKQNMDGEECAIRYYKDLFDRVIKVDPVTAHTIGEILGDEVEHEDDLESMLEDVLLIKRI